MTPEKNLQLLKSTWPNLTWQHKVHPNGEQYWTNWENENGVRWRREPWIYVTHIKRSDYDWHYEISWNLASIHEVCHGDDLETAIEKISSEIAPLRTMWPTRDRAPTKLSHLHTDMGRAKRKLNRSGRYWEKTPEGKLVHESSQLLVQPSPLTAIAPKPNLIKTDEI